MKKFSILWLLFVAGLMLSACESEPDEQEPIDDDQDETETYVELINDPTFSTGFHLLGTSPVATGREVFRWINYDGQATPTDDVVWHMAQWWTRYDFTDAPERYEDGLFVYENEGRKIKVNPETGYFYKELWTDAEYDKPREQGESWPHLLIEQAFTEEVYLQDATAIEVELDFTIHYVENMMDDGTYHSNNHTAHLLWYFTLNNRPQEPGEVEDVGEVGDYLWFGVPIYDYRYGTIQQSAHIDQGFDGATNKLIYSMSNRHYLPTPIDLNQRYQMRIDILPFLKEAYEYAQNNNALENVKFENLMFTYMNFGWEIPGTFNVASDIEHISVKVYYD